MILKIILRSILREKVNFSMVLLGLVAGFCGILTLQLIIGFELNFDSFHQDEASTYRVITRVEDDDLRQLALTDGGLKQFLQETFNEVSVVSHFIPLYYGISVKSNGETFVEENGYYVDENFNKVFDFNILSGDGKSMFSETNSIALTKTLALKYFGSVEALGHTMIIDDGFGERAVKVTGVYQDAPMHSSIKFDFLVSGQTYNFWERFIESPSRNHFHTFLKFEEGISEETTATIESYLNKRNARINENGLSNNQEYKFQPMSEIHFDTATEYDLSEKTNITQLYILTFLSISILLITGINFINANAIQSASKFKLLGMISVLGQNSQQSKILILDALFKTMIAIALALFLLYFLNHSVFDQYFGFRLYMPSVYPLLAGLSICFAIGLFSGLLPVRQWKKKSILDVIKGKQLVSKGKYPNFRLSALAVQLSVVIILLVTTSIVIKQVDYIQSKNVGYDKTNKLLIPAPKGVDSQSYLEFIHALEAMHYVHDVGISWYSFFDKYGTVAIETEQSKNWDALFNMVNSSFISSMGIKIKEGRNFSGNYSSDTVGILINKTAADLIGTDIINSMIVASPPLYENSKFSVIGVMEDFHFESFNNSIQPLIYFCLPFDDFAGDITISYHPAAYESLRKDLQTHWARSGIQTPLEFATLDNSYRATYQKQMLLGNIAKGFSLLVLFLALFGLFSYLKHNVEYRTKEMAIRRVLGATALNVFTSMNREITLLFLISVVVAIPIGLLIAMRWMDQFAYRANIGAYDLILPAAFTFGIILMVGAIESIVILKHKTMDILKNE